MCNARADFGADLLGLQLTDADILAIFLVMKYEQEQLGGFLQVTALILPVSDT
jgi:hypothetical protein